MLTAAELHTLVDRYYEERDNESKCPLRMSALGSCPRSLFMQMRGIERKTLDARTKRIFETGHDRGRSLGKAIEAAVLTKYPTATVEFEREVELPLHVPGLDAAAVCKSLGERFGYKDIPVRPLMLDQQTDKERSTIMIRGRIDVLASFGGNHAIKVEVKTKGSYGFDKLEAEGVGFEYGMQCLGYTDALLQRGIVVVSDLFLFENKDDSDIKPIEFNAAAFAGEYRKQLDRLRHVLLVYQEVEVKGRALSAIELPPAMYVDPVDAQPAGGKLPWQCNYCPIGPERGLCCPSGRTLSKGKPFKPGGVPPWSIR